MAGNEKSSRRGSLRWFMAGLLLLSAFIFYDFFNQARAETPQLRLRCPAGKRHVNGTCVCPVLFSGSDDCGRPSEGLRPGCVTPARDLRGFEPLTFDTSAVVGSSAALAKGGHPYGREIDSHSVVIRFNDAPTRGFERWVGSTTTLRIQNVLYCGFAESPHELCMRYTLDHTRGVHKCKNEYRCRKVNGTRHMVFYAMNYWRLAPPSGLHNGHGIGRKLSAGFFGVGLSLHLCGQVDVYGVEGGRSHYFVKAMDGNKKPFHKRHNWAWERQCLNKLKNGLLPRVSIK